MIEKNEKSVLDGIPRDDSNWRIKETPGRHLVIVGACNKCGAPIYGCKYIPQGTVPPLAYSCSCFSAPAPAPGEVRTT